MNIKTAISIDHLIGTPLCWILNIITHCVGLILKRDHKPPYHIKKILIIKLMGIGSIVQALPLIEGLSRRYPKADIRMLCFSETEIFTKHLTLVSEVFTVDNRSFLKLGWTALKKIITIIRWRPDLVLDLEYHSKFSSLLATMTCALNRACLFDAATRFRYYLYTHWIYANPRRHISDLYNHLGRIFCVESFKSLGDCAPYIRIGAIEEAEADRVLTQHSIDPRENIFIINVNAGELCLERRWPSQNFAALSEHMTKAGIVLLVGSHRERNYVESVRDLITNNAIRMKVHNFAGKLSFGAFLAILKQATIVITNDSGPMHLAALLDAHVVSLWGPGIPSAYEPRTPKHVPLWEDVFCSPCLYIVPEPPCGGNNICMQSLTVRKVLEAVYKQVPELSTQSDIQTKD